MVIPLNNPARTISSHEFPGRFAHHFVQIRTNVTISTQFSLTKVLYLCKFVSFRGFHGIFHGLASLRLVDLNCCHLITSSYVTRLASLRLVDLNASATFANGRADCLASLRLVDLNYSHHATRYSNFRLASLRLVDLNIKMLFHKCVVIV